MAFIRMLKSKIHGARVIESRLDYEGSITIDADIMKAARLYPGEMVIVANVTTGARFETYCIEGAAGSGNILVNGAAAHLAKPGDVLIIFAHHLVDEKDIEKEKPWLVYLDSENRITEVKRELPAEKTVVRF